MSNLIINIIEDKCSREIPEKKNECVLYVTSKYREVIELIQICSKIEKCNENDIICKKLVKLCEKYGKYTSNEVLIDQLIKEFEKELNP